MKRYSMRRACVRASVVLTVLLGFQAQAEAFHHMHVTIPKPFIIGGAGSIVTISFHTAQSQPTPYTGNVDVFVTHTPKGFSEIGRWDPYWDGSLQYVWHTYVVGARVSHGAAYGTHIVVPVAGTTSTWVSLGIYSFGTVTVTAEADDKSASDTVSDIWIRGRATTYADDRDIPDGATYIVALPYASGDPQVLLRGTTITVRNKDDQQKLIHATINYPGPMVPVSPHYPPTSQHWNHYWGAGGWPPLAVMMQGLTRVRQLNGVDYGDVEFSRQIIDLDTLHTDANGDSCAEKLGITGDGTVDWKFD